jgi:hypothetical protein
MKKEEMTMSDEKDKSDESAKKDEVKKKEPVFLLFDHDVTAEAIMGAIKEHREKKSE